MSHADILDKAMYDRKSLIVLTKERGEIIGIPHAVDEFETDDERLGYFIEIGDHFLDTVYLDEITEIKYYNADAVLLIPQSSLLRVSGN